MDIIIRLRNHRKGIELRYFNAETGEIIYDTVFTPVSGGLDTIITGIKKSQAGRFDGARLRWEVDYVE